VNIAMTNMYMFILLL